MVDRFVWWFHPYSTRSEARFYLLRRNEKSIYSTNPDEAVA